MKVGRRCAGFENRVPEDRVPAPETHSSGIGKVLQSFLVNILVVKAEIVRVNRAARANRCNLLAPLATIRVLYHILGFSAMRMPANVTGEPFIEFEESGALVVEGNGFLIVQVPEPGTRLAHSGKFSIGEVGYNTE